MNRAPRIDLGWTWWLGRLSYFLVLMRELAAVFIAAYAVLFAILVHKAGQSQASYQAYLDFLWNPGMVVFHVLALGFTLWHSLTWFNLTPRAMPGFMMRIGERKLPSALIIAPQWLALAAVSGLIVWWVAWVGVT